MCIRDSNQAVLRLGSRQGVNLYTVNLASMACSHTGPFACDAEGAMFVALDCIEGPTDAILVGVALPDFRKHKRPFRIRISHRDTNVIFLGDCPDVMRTENQSHYGAAVVAAAYANNTADPDLRRKWYDYLDRDCHWANFYAHKPAYHSFAHADESYGVQWSLSQMANPPPLVRNCDPVPMMLDGLRIAVDTARPLHGMCACAAPVSYTHLTLPTIYSV